MSANYCSDIHLAYLLAAGIALAQEESSNDTLSWQNPERETRHLGPMTLQQTGQMLRDRNVLNLRHHLSEETARECIPGDTTFRIVGTRFRAHHRPDPIQVLKAAACYRYQCCDEDGWEGSEAKSFTDGLIALAIRRLPGYEEAQWGPPRDTDVRLRIQHEV